MKKETARYSVKAHSKRGRASSEHLNQEWQELEAQNERLKPDWMGLAAQFGFSDSPY